MTENITVFKQNSNRIETDKGNVYIDPFEMEEELHDAAFILITHDHYDHFAPASIEKVANDKTIFIVPEKMKGKVREATDFVAKTVTVKPGMSYEMDGLAFETVAAYNLLKPFHPKSAELIGAICPEVAIPVHYGGLVGSVKDGEVFAGHIKTPTKVEYKIEF